MALGKVTGFKHLRHFLWCLYTVLGDFWPTKRLKSACLFCWQFSPTTLNHFAVFAKVNFFSFFKKRRMATVKLWNASGVHHRHFGPPIATFHSTHFCWLYLRELPTVHSTLTLNTVLPGGAFKCLKEIWWWHIQLWGIVELFHLKPLTEYVHICIYFTFIYMKVSNYY